MSTLRTKGPSPQNECEVIERNSNLNSSHSSNHSNKKRKLNSNIIMNDDRGVKSQSNYDDDDKENQISNSTDSRRNAESGTPFPARNCNITISNSIQVNNISLRPASISRMGLINFMAYEKINVEFEPGVNLITAPNGAGNDAFKQLVVTSELHLTYLSKSHSLAS